jgi:hypothetical protein
MKADVWGYFHDGTIERIEELGPGELILSLSALYLREMFPGTGSSFILSLSKCNLFQYQAYEQPPTQDIGEIEEQQLELLYIVSTDPLVLGCSTGTLTISYQQLSLTLDTGEPIDLEQLQEASKKYWEQWQKSGTG